MNKIKVINAIYIKFRNLMNSVAIKLCLFLLLSASVVMAFLPFFKQQFFPEKDIKVQIDGFDYGETNTNGIEFVEIDPDVLITYQSDTIRYVVKVYTKDGYSGLSTITNYIYKLNLANYYTMFSTTDMELFTNSNIDIVDYSESSKVDNASYTFLMSIVFMYFIMATILISRIAAQITNEKGNQVTEVILTSLTRKQLYISELISSFLVILVNVLVITVPILVAIIIDKPEITSDYSFLNWSTAILVIVHLCMTIFSIIILCIGLCSLSKEPEDSNVFSTLFLIPILVSYLYTVFNFSLFKGIWTFFNYIPILSIFPILAELITGSMVGVNMIGYLFVDLLFIIGLFYISQKVFSKHIAKT